MSRLSLLPHGMRVLVMRAPVLLALGVLAGCSALSTRDPGLALCSITDGVDPCPPPLRCIDERCQSAGCAGEPMPETCDNRDNDCDMMVDEGNPCAAGMCVGGTCRTDCTSDERICDNMDDDCDGMVDEGLTRDADMDRFSVCPPAGAAADCDDRNPNIHPGVAELCNGVDDDCDAATIESSMNDCATGLTCAVPSGESIPRCVDPRDCSQFPCPVGLICNAMNSCCTTGTPGCGTPLDCTTTGCAVGSRCLPDITGGTFSCVPFGAVGDSCVRPADCNSGRCYTRASLLLEGAGSICGTACCSDAQCEASQACWAPGTGARSCVPRALLPPTPPSACARETDCPGSVCGLHTFDVPGSPSGGHAMTCDVPGARTCGGTACPAGICISATECGTPCGRSMGECAFNIIDGPTEACVYYTLMDDRIITACGPAGGFFRQGDSCGGFLRPCIDGLCLSGHCADVCCSDADCPATTACTPYMNFGWEMRCLPRVAGPVP